MSSTISTLGVGSGLDLNGILTQLQSAERMKLKPILQERAQLQSKISAFGSLKGALSDLQNAMEKLGKPETYSASTSSVTGDAVKAAANADAAKGNYNVTVNTLATTYSIATEGIADKETNLGATTITIDMQDGSQLSLDVAHSKSSLEEIKDAINDLEGGVTATLINDGSGTPYRLSLSSTESGTDAAITNVDFGALNGTLNLDAATEVAAVNANFDVNGVNITSQSNQVEDAIEGVTLTLEEVGESTVSIELDEESVKKAVESFVLKYNALDKTIDELRAYDAATGKGGPLMGNSTLYNAESQVDSVLSEAGTEGAFALLSELGIEKELDGTLKINKDEFNEIIDNNLGDLEKFFAGTDGVGGMAEKLDNVLETLLEEDGLVDAATEGLESTLDSLEERQASAERMIDSTIERYRSSFARLDGMVASMNAAGGMLMSQLNALSSQFGNNNKS